MPGQPMRHPARVTTPLAAALLIAACGRGKNDPAGGEGGSVTAAQPTGGTGGMGEMGSGKSVAGVGGTGSAASMPGITDSTNVRGGTGARTSSGAAGTTKRP